MGKVDEGHSIQLIDGNGQFNVAGIENFAKEVEMNKWGVSYAVVSIMGPQSSGKSTLLNRLFHTNFWEMDALKGRSQTTKGIWMAKCAGIEPCTLVMDVEGTDGGERGENDTAFEKKSTLFALYVSDILLINMWCHDIGRENAANKPLLRNVFQVGMRLFGDFGSRKRTLMFVVRDMTSRTPSQKLESQLRNDLQKIWDSAPKLQVNMKTPLGKFFNVEVVFLPSYEAEENVFKILVSRLRDRFMNSIESDGLAGDRRDVVPASVFSFKAQQIWKEIKDNRDLNLPAVKFEPHPLDPDGLHSKRSVKELVAGTTAYASLIVTASGAVIAVGMAFSAPAAITVGAVVPLIGGIVSVAARWISWTTGRGVVPLHGD